MKQNFDDVNARDETDEQTTFAFFNDLHINLSVAIEKREDFDATTDRETISVQNSDFFDVAIDEVDDTFSERSRTISDVEIARDKNFDDEKDDDSKANETDEIENEIANSTNC